MFTVDHRPIQIALALLMMFVAGVGCFRVVRGKRKLLRIPSQIIASVLVVASGLLLFIEGCVETTTDVETTSPIYSPDRRRAIVIRKWNAGPLGGGGLYVDLYSLGGLREETIAGSGDWDEVGVRWNSDKNVELRIAPSRWDTCSSTPSVRVTCDGYTPNFTDVK